MQQIPLFDARNRLSAVVHEVESGTPIELTRHGKPAVVMVSSESFRRMREEGRTFAGRYERFREQFADIVADTGYEDPFGDLRAVEPGRPVEL